MPAGIYIRTEEIKKKQSKAMRGRVPPNKGKKGCQTAWNIGLNGDVYFKHYRIGSFKGVNNPNWKGGIENSKDKRNTIEYREWRLMVFGRDSFICQDCGRRGTYLEAHHIKSWKDYPELRFDINNGITLCKECHKKVHKRG